MSRDFDGAMLEIYRRAKSEANYNASGFLGLLNDRGGLGAAKYLLNLASPSEGFTHLWERGRLDLTVEAMIVEGTRWHELFTREELEKARARLAAYHYSPKANEDSTVQTASEDTSGATPARLRLRDIISDDSKIWARPVWAPLSGKDRVSAYGKEDVARRLESSFRPRLDFILNIAVGTVKRNLPRELIGHVLNVVTIVPRVMRTEDIVGKQRYLEWMQEIDESGATRWPWGLPVEKAWRIVNPPHSDDVLPNLRSERFVYHHPEQMLTLLSNEEVAALLHLELEPVDFEVAIADVSGLAGQRLASRSARQWASKLARIVAAKCGGSRRGYVRIRPDFETNETDLEVLIASLIESQKERCALCDGPLDLSEDASWLAQPSADRIDGNLRVYDRTNLQVTHLACNFGKNSASNAEAVSFFRNWCGNGTTPDADR